VKKEELSSTIPGLDAAPPLLTRSKTTQYPFPQPLPAHLQYMEDEVTITVTRTPTHSQPLSAILPDLPDGIREIVAGVLDRVDSTNK
jgi:hypothetical protein